MYNLLPITAFHAKRSESDREWRIALHQSDHRSIIDFILSLFFKEHSNLLLHMYYSAAYQNMYTWSVYLYLNYGG